MFIIDLFFTLPIVESRFFFFSSVFGGLFCQEEFLLISPSRGGFGVGRIGREK